MTTISKTSIDVRNIKETDCTPSEFPLQKLKLENRPDGFQMIVNRSTLNAMKEHGQTSMNAEVGGMLVGELCWDGEAFLVVEASVIGEHTDGNVASVTFTAETWEHVWSVMEKDYPDKSIVGWYHTHPGFGIFLSHMDLFICEHTFNAPHHVAYVYDPQSEDDGWFIWNNSKPTKIKPLVIEDAPALQSNRHIRLSTNNSVMQAAADKIVISSEETQDNWTVILIIFSTILLILCTSGIGYLTFENINSQNENKQLKNEITTLKEDIKTLHNNTNRLYLWSESNEVVHRKRLRQLRDHQEVILVNCLKIQQGQDNRGDDVFVITTHDRGVIPLSVLRQLQPPDRLFIEEPQSLKEPAQQKPNFRVKNNQQPLNPKEPKNVR